METRVYKMSGFKKLVRITKTVLGDLFGMKLRRAMYPDKLRKT